MNSAHRDALNAYLAADLHYSGVAGGWRVYYSITRRALYFQRVLRRAEYWHSRPRNLCVFFMQLWYRFRLARLGERTGMYIPRGTCAAGLSIAHPGLLVINGHARIGPRCRLSQGVTIGAASDGAPVLGPDVFVGPNAQVIGRVTVAQGTTVLPGAVVIKDTEPFSTVGGVPAKTVKTGTPPWHQTLLHISPRPTDWM